MSSVTQSSHSNVKAELFEQRFVLHNVDPDEYQRWVSALRDRRLRHTYFRGQLELMRPTSLHERVRGLLGRMIETMSLECDIPIKSYGSTTFRPPGADHGLEGDEIYFVNNEAAASFGDDYDPENDPPPDLAVEVDIWSRSVGRRETYAAWGVAEVWLHDGEHLQILWLTNGVYERREQSLAFPFADAETIGEFVEKRHEMDEHQLIKQFRDWARDRCH